MANEKRLIYLEDVLEEIDDAISNIAYTSPYQNDISTMVSGMERVRDVVENALTVDAVEVVRCKDCKGMNEDKFCIGRRLGQTAI